MTTTPKLAIFTIATTLVYLGIAVLGWGGFAAFFSHPARIALAVRSSSCPALRSSPREI